MISVSIILTTYNSGDQLLEVINSITNQNGIGIDFSIELIVVDDCSTDNTLEILKNNNIQFFSTKKILEAQIEEEILHLKNVMGILYVLLIMMMFGFLIKF